jgi:hypothetical protein
MPAAWARMIYVCGFLQDKGVLYRIRRPQLARARVRARQQEVYALRARARVSPACGTFTLKNRR